MENIKRKELQVSAIENGTVIDHIDQGVVQKVLKILGLEDCTEPIYLGGNLDSKKMGKKGIIKVTNVFFKAEELNKIALISPNATIIEIHDFAVTKKTKVNIPDEIFGFVKCFNPNCITNINQVKTHFHVIDKDTLKLRCHYCEKITDKKNIEYK